MSIFNKSKSKLDDLAGNVAGSDIGKKLNINKTKASFGILAITGSAIAMSVYFAFLNNKPSCSSSSAKNLVIDIVSNSGTSDSFKYPFLRDLESQQPKISSLSEDAEYIRLEERVAYLQNDIQTKMNACRTFDNSAAERELSAKGVTELEILDHSISIRVGDDSASFKKYYGADVCAYFLDELGEEKDIDNFPPPQNRHVNSTIKNVLDNYYNASLNYYYKYGSDNIYPIAKQLAKAEDEQKDYRESYNNTNNISRKSRNDENEQIWLSRKNDISFELINIITTDKNDSTGSVSCKAEIGAFLDDLSLQQQIQYTIEKNSDGDLFATVWKL